MKVIEIYDKDEEGYLKVSLKEILDIYKKFFSIWKLYELDVQYIKEPKTNIPNDFPNTDEKLWVVGYKANFDFFYSLSEDIFQEINVILCAWKKEETVAPYSYTKEFYNSCDIVISCIDNTLWEIYSKDEEIIRPLIDRFKDIRVIDELDFNQKA